MQTIDTLRVSIGFLQKFTFTVPLLRSSHPAGGSIVSPGYYFQVMVEQLK